MKKILYILAAAALLCGCSSQKDAAPASSPVIYELNTRQFTPEGTFKAASAHLQRLKDQGVDVVWVMPLYPIGEKERKGSLGSYYAIRDYCDVNPEFGTLDDFDDFVKEAHRAGLKVIIDWVANHTSPDHAWVTEKPSEWYVRDENGNTIVEYDWTDIAKLNYDCPDVRSEMQKCMAFWVDRGVDGFRCDVAYQIPQDFWAETISSLRDKASRPLFFLAEGEETWLHDAGFDATYAWKLHHLMNDIASGKATAARMREYVDWNAAEYGSRFRLAFTSNHDENSWSGTEFERMGGAWKQMTALCFTLPSSLPLIYTAQEAGYDHRFAFFEKDPVPAEVWNDPDRASFADFYRDLAALYHSHPALHDADASFEWISDNGAFAGDDCIAFRRQKGDDIVRVYAHMASPWEYEIKLGSERITRVEPPCWWVGLKTDLQLLVQGPGIGSWSASVEGGEGVKVTGTHAADSPNYLFVDVAVSPSARAGTFNLVFEKDGETLTYPYEILARREGSAERKGFDSSDLIYLIMPDRFANGDPSNDDTVFTADPADRGQLPGRHGGDIQGIIDHLDYLQDLGVTAIWNTPLLLDNEPESSYHGYACADYYNIDPRFGGNGMYRSLVQKCHARGIKMIMDVVTNHCGSAHWWMADLPFEDWIHQWPAYTHSNCDFAMPNDIYASEKDRYNMQSGWFDTSMPDMNLDNPYLLQYFKQYAVWWTEWADLDGFRVDTYPYNEKEPMSQWCASVMEEYPNLNIVGEVWTNNIAQLAYWQKDAFNRDGFNSNLPAIMDFPLQSAFCQGIGADRESWDDGLGKVYDAVANSFYYADPQNVLVFPSNHDTARLGNVVQRDPDRCKMILALTATIRGIPQIFSGDEQMFTTQGGWHKDGALRVDFPGGWEGDVFDLFTPEGRQACDVDFDGSYIPAGVRAEVFDYARTLFNWRKTATAVHDGQTLHFLRRDNTYAFFRYTDDSAVYVFANNNPRPVTVPWADYQEFTSTRTLGVGRDVISGSPVDFSAPVTVGPKQTLIVEF